MKRLFLSLTILFVISPLFVISAPNFGDGNSKFCVYDYSYNRELFKKLDREYDERCIVQLTPYSSTNICDMDSYYRMVMQPYVRQKQNFNF